MCKAEDTIKEWSLTLTEHYGVANWMHSNPYEIDGKKKKWHYLMDKIEIATGRKVMVTQNVQTDLDITYGAWGEIVDIILNPGEPLIGDEPIAELKYLPSYIHVKLHQTWATQLDGLEEGVILVEVSSKTFKITVSIRGQQHTHFVK